VVAMRNQRKNEGEEKNKMPIKMEFPAQMGRI
jgi:hypothetical protein